MAHSSPTPRPERSARRPRIALRVGWPRLPRPRISRLGELLRLGKIRQLPRRGDASHARGAGGHTKSVRLGGRGESGGLAGLAARVHGARIWHRGLLTTRWLANRRLRTKFLIVIIIGGVVSVGIGATSLSVMASMQEKSDYLYKQNMARIAAIGQVQRTLLEMRANILNAAASTSPEARFQFLNNIENDDQALDGAMATYTRFDVTGRERSVKLLKESITSFRAVRDDDLLPAIDSGDLKRFTEARDISGDPAFSSMAVAAETLVQIEMKSAAEQNAASLRAYQDARSNVLIILVGGVLVALLIGFWITGIVSRSVGRVADVAVALSRGDLTASADVDSTDEVGRMAAALDDAARQLRGTIGMVDRFSEELAHSSQQLSGVSTQLDESAAETSRQADSVSAASEQVSANVRSVAAASEELGISISAIASNASEAAMVAQEASRVASSVSQDLEKLGTSSTQIGNVIGTITSIAEQTQLLALNATIEAAHAGEAGKGFAIVASEVKELANGTGHATEDVSSRITAVQADSGTALRGIRQIVHIIDKVDDYSNMIAATVEEQAATTCEIGRTVHEAAKGSLWIAEHITKVATAAEATANGVREARRAAEDLSHMSSELRQAVRQFTL